MSKENSEKLNYIIETVGDAERIILGDARQKVLAFDWGHFRIERKEVDKLFDFLSRLVLRNTGINRGLNFLIAENPKELARLHSLLPIRKKKDEPSGQFWLALLRPEMSPLLFSIIYESS